MRQAHKIETPYLLPMLKLELSGKLLNQLEFGCHFDDNRVYSNDEIFKMTGGYLKNLNQDDDELMVTFMYYDHHNEPVTTVCFRSGVLDIHKHDWSGTKYAGRKMK